MIIKKIWGELSYDSRKEKTIAVYVETEKGAFAGSAPEGKSTGKYEAPAFIGGVESVIGKINSLSEKIIKLNIDKFDDLIEVEKIVNKNNVRNPLVSGSTKSGLRLRTDMDKDFVGCGANAVIALESAILKALAADQKKEIWELINPKARKFPYPIGNVIGGGKHTELTKGSKPDFQEFLIIPQSDRFSENVDIMNEVHSVLKKKLKTLRARGKLNDEGAWSTSLNNEEVLRVLDDVRNDLILQTNKKISIGVDVAASSFYSKGDYKYKNQRKKLSKGDQLKLLKNYIDKYQISYLEDGFDEQSFGDFKKLKEIEGKKCLLVGDDLTVSHMDRLKKAIKNKSVNGIIVKPNQSGSLIEIQEVIKLAKRKGIKTIFSHRSGETMDNIVADLAFGFQTEFVKFGVKGKEREVKLGRLVEIEKSLR